MGEVIRVGFDIPVRIHQPGKKAKLKPLRVVERKQIPSPNRDGVRWEQTIWGGQGVWSLTTQYPANKREEVQKQVERSYLLAMGYGPNSNYMIVELE